MTARRQRLGRGVIRCVREWRSLQLGWRCTCEPPRGLPLAPLGEGLLPLLPRPYDPLNQRQHDEESEQDKRFDRHAAASTNRCAGTYRFGGVGSSLLPSAMDSRIDESAWMFFMR
jgi:hypothetical protein